MKVGEIVEILIYIRKHKSLGQEESEAVCAACRILDRLPRVIDEEDAEGIIQEGRGTAA